MNFHARKHLEDRNKFKELAENCLSIFSKWRHNCTLPRSLFTQSWSIRNSTSTEHKKSRIWPHQKNFSKKWSPKHEDSFIVKKNFTVLLLLVQRKVFSYVFFPFLWLAKFPCSECSDARLLKWGVTILSSYGPSLSLTLRPIILKMFSLSY